MLNPRQQYLHQPLYGSNWLQDGEVFPNWSLPTITVTRNIFPRENFELNCPVLGQFNEHLKWKISGRFDYDAAYDLSNFYPEPVRDNQRAQFFVRENYLDVSAGDFDFRLGRQHVIWGEMVGLFFAELFLRGTCASFSCPPSTLCVYRSGRCGPNIPSTIYTPKYYGYLSRPLMRSANQERIITRALFGEQRAI